MTDSMIDEDPLVDLVVPDDSTAEFLAAADRGVFLIRRSPSGRALEPALVTCPDTGSADLKWEPAGGGAEVVSWTVTDGGPAFPGQHIVIAIGQLDEGPWWWARIVDADPAQMRLGARLRIVFRRPAGGGQAVPLFAVDHDAAGSEA